MIRKVHGRARTSWDNALWRRAGGISGGGAGPFRRPRSSPIALARTALRPTTRKPVLRTTSPVRGSEKFVSYQAATTRDMPVGWRRGRGSVLGLWLRPKGASHFFAPFGP